MIIFKKIKYRNFLSSGNVPIDINLDENSATLIVGKNGSGKSSFTDAISYGLFGIPLRSIKKPQLINAINEKDCKVEIYFDIKNKSYRIVRGQKPAIFEIYENGKLFRQSSTTRDYQIFLETHILKMNHKSFHQVVVLGSSSFIPFMQLPAGHRRTVIEDLLDIQVFSRMNSLLKEDIQKMREELKEITNKVSINSTKTNLQSKHVEDLRALNNNRLRELNKEKRDLTQNIKIISKEINGLTKEIGKNLGPSKQNVEDLEKEKKELRNKRTRAINSMQDLASQIQFLKKNINCPVCNQLLTETHKKDCSKKYKKKGNNLGKDLEQIEKLIFPLSKQLEEGFNEIKQIQIQQKKVSDLNLEISWEIKKIENLEQKIESIRNNKGNLSKAKNELKILQESLDKIEKTKEGFTKDQIYNGVISEMLKDSGIKTKIIKQYLPSMNKIINQYLRILDFFIYFELDENFNETIKSRHRDEFSYSSFSEGEKCRINLSILFAWRQVAKMKNSASTNLLILDEIFDSSLDLEGIDNLMKILNTLGDDTNAFIISHKGDVLSNWFPGKIEFKKTIFSEILNN